MPDAAGQSPSDVSLLTVDRVSLRYGGADAAADAPFAVQDISLTVEPGKFVSIVGPSGCGKSTLLKMVSGLEMPTVGSIRVRGTPVSGVRRDVGFVFQTDALLPWKTLRENVGLALRYRGVARAEASRRAQGWLDRVGIGALGDRYPHQVSGGQRKRASICATMVYEPELMLMDEPFSALDVQTRDLIETDVLRVWGELRSQSIIFVTHDLEEAIAMSDRVVVLTRGPGRIKADYAIDLPRGRDVREIRSDARFMEIYQTIWRDLRVEVLATHDRQMTMSSE
ncbi:MAG: ABC transporter ATP-binding protein [Burkholderiales bacterium]